MLNRRSLLISLGTLTLGSLLAGCNSRSEATLRVQMLKDSIPAQLLTEFQRQSAKNASLSFSPTAQLAELFALLQTWQRQAPPKSGLPDWVPLAGSNPVAPKADLVTLGDYWLAAAIQQNLIQPLELADLDGWSRLRSPIQWQNLVRRNDRGELDANGQIWGAPYRWGTTVIAYRLEEFRSLGWTPTNWDDLWRPELAGRISLLDSPRETIGFTLKKLGESVNTDNLDSVTTLKAELAALHRQARFYSSDSYLQPLLVGDTWAAVGWSTDLLPLLKRDRRIAAIVPAAGTILTADLWVRPAIASNQPSDDTSTSLALQWINFCWQPDVAVQLALLGSGASPIIANPNQSALELPDAIRDNSILLPPTSVLQNSEFLQPLSAATAEQYRRLWMETRRQTG